ncbi:uncharacterized protein LOC115439019 [Sphaeramia orbicularis]|uniref:uncharacterized protein LOC115439019 n=1 Tax=Sphaeramia orbicularis TaxID=375764 RepID=UPI001180A6D9|nr:uncharacterized protein LOC115439019 [Sphaeramia orbicularis]
MTIGKNSRKSSVRSSIRAPKFLDKSNGFYGRLDEPEIPVETEEVRATEVEEMKDEKRSSQNSVMDISGADDREEPEIFNEGTIEDDGETLLRRKPSRRNSRWRRSSRRKQKEARAEDDTGRDGRLSQDTEDQVDPHALEDSRAIILVEMEKLKKMEEENEKTGKEKESALVHFPVPEEADDQVLIRDKKRGRVEEGEEERRMKREQEEGMKVVKRNTMKNYRKALDRAFRRGWEAFITNLYSVTLTPVTPSSPSSSSPLSKKKHQHNSVLAEFQ